MNKIRFSNYRYALTALALGGIFAVAQPVAAQQANEDQSSSAIDEVVKVEAQVERRQTGPGITSTARTEIIELRKQVSFADLDLTKYADVIELENRIEATAEEACEKLDEMYPQPRSNAMDRHSCVTRAIKTADQELKAAIAAAS